MLERGKAGADFQRCHPGRKRLGRTVFAEVFERCRGPVAGEGGRLRRWPRWAWHGKRSCPATDLGRDSNAFLRLLGKYVLSPLAPFIKYWSNPKTATKVVARVFTDDSSRTDVYHDEKGRPVSGSALVRQSEFTERVVAETRALPARVPA